MTLMFVSKAIGDSNNGLGPVRHQAIIWNNTGLLHVEPLEHNSLKFELYTQISFQENVIEMAAICLVLNADIWITFRQKVGEDSFQQ